jgi:hypothetical protein
VVTRRAVRCPSCSQRTIPLSTYVPLAPPSPSSPSCFESLKNRTTIKKHWPPAPDCEADELAIATHHLVTIEKKIKEVRAVFLRQQCSNASEVLATQEKITRGGRRGAAVVAHTHACLQYLFFCLDRSSIVFVSFDRSHIYI